MLLVLILALGKLGLPGKGILLHAISVSALICFFYMILGLILSTQLSLSNAESLRKFSLTVAWIGYVASVLQIFIGVWLAGIFNGVVQKLKTSTLYGPVAMALLCMAFSLSSFHGSSSLLGSVIVLRTDQAGISASAMRILAFSMGLGIPIGLAVVFLGLFLEKINNKQWWRRFQAVAGVLLMIVAFGGMAFASGHQTDTTDNPTAIVAVKGPGHQDEEINKSDSADENESVTGFYFFKLTDYQTALEAAQVMNKPVFIYFTGHGCSSGKEMEASILSDPGIRKRIMTEFVAFIGYVDDRKPLPELQQYTSEHTGKSITTHGQRISDIQASTFKSNAVPFFVIIDKNGRILAETGYLTEVVQFHDFLDHGRNE